MAAADDPDGQGGTAQTLGLGGATASSFFTTNPYAALQGGGLNTQAALLAQLQGAGDGGGNLASIMGGQHAQQLGASPIGVSAPTMVRGKIKDLDPVLLQRLDALGRKLGKPVDIISGNRTRAEQADLYQRYLNGTGNLAAPPGQSNHEHGAAADAYVDGVALANVPGARDAAARLGLHFPVGGEAWHVERRDV